jgi:tRNA uridine 5-carboxymethylaminomethyl modification enzyme
MGFMPGNGSSFDVIVIGGGHAGAEAAWAAAHLGANVALVTLDPARIGQMSCNPAIGGSAKGQIVREVDALGGLMGLAADAAGIQFRMLNLSKGAAVHGPRAQCDKYRYAAAVQDLLAAERNIKILAGEVAELLVSDGAAGGVQLAGGRTLVAPAVVVTTGTFMRGLMHTGETKTEGGRIGEAAARTLSGHLARLGFELGRLKTGTPPRLRSGSIDWRAFEEQPGDETPRPFSFLNEYESWRPPLGQVSCHIGHTTGAAHEAIRANLHRAPMFCGQIEGVGPRYCPSIEDKVVRFADKQQHQVFLEPESLDTDEIYCNGISTSLPADVQRLILDNVRGLEKAEVIRWGYAVEYDMVWPRQIRSTLETKLVSGLFLAGQINGTSGYEEAAGQGYVAGVNAARLAATGEADFVLRRDEAYIGVMIDDLVTKPPTEPYRMFTSRAEHRLHLRADNADERLTPVGRAAGTVTDARWERFESRRAAVERAVGWARATRIDGKPIFDWLRTPGMTMESLAVRMGGTASPAGEAVAPGLVPSPDTASPAGEAVAPSSGIARLVEIRARYDGYLQRQDRQLEEFARLETKLIPPGLDYATVSGLRREARETLIQFTPRSLGQALRLSGVTPADVTLLAVHLSRHGAR